MSTNPLLERISQAQRLAEAELRESAAYAGRVPSALEVHQARVNAGEEVVMANLAQLGLLPPPSNSR